MPANFRPLTFNHESSKTGDMKNKPQQLERRNFLKSMLLAAASLPFLGSLESWASKAAAPAKKAKEIPLPAGKTAVSESDPVAAAIGYKADVATVDFKKYPQRKKPEAKNQFCDNCALYVKDNDGWGKCQMLPSGVVAAKGWCGSYSKKPA